MDYVVKFHKKPKLKNLELKVFTPSAESPTVPPSGEVEIQVGTKKREINGEYITFSMQQIVKHALFSIALELEAVFKINPVPTPEELKDNTSLAEILINKLLPKSCQIIAFVTDSMGYVPLILPPRIKSQ